MNKEKVFDFRFLAPPSIIVFLVFVYSPSNFVKFIDSLNISWLTGTLIGTTGILAVGFFISNLTYFLVKFFLGIIDRRCTPLYAELFKLEEFNNPNNITALELGDRMALDIIDKEANNNSQIIDQAEKRWGMALANFNCFVASCISVIVVICLMTSGIYKSVWEWNQYCIFLFLFLFLFGFNGWKAHRSAFEINFMEAKYAKQLIQKKS
jgi:hypothetical protein